MAKKETNMKQMKKIITILSLSIIVLIATNCYAVDTFELEFKVIENKKNEKFDLYLLLPENYIKFAIEKANLKIDYEGVSTLKENQILGLTSSNGSIQDEIYEEDNIQYIQIRLNKENDIYSFDILEDYPKMDIKYRIKNMRKDYIVHIDNFKIEKGKCEIEYDYVKDTVKQPNKKVISFNIKTLFILLLIIIIVGTIAYQKGRK